MSPTPRSSKEAPGANEGGGLDDTAPVRPPPMSDGATPWQWRSRESRLRSSTYGRRKLLSPPPSLSLSLSRRARAVSRSLSRSLCLTPTQTRAHESGPTPALRRSLSADSLRCRARRAFDERHGRRTICSERREYQHSVRTHCHVTAASLPRHCHVTAMSRTSALCPY